MKSGLKYHKRLSPPSPWPSDVGGQEKGKFFQRVAQKQKNWILLLNSQPCSIQDWEICRVPSSQGPGVRSGAVQQPCTDSVVTSLEVTNYMLDPPL